MIVETKKRDMVKQGEGKGGFELIFIPAEGDAGSCRSTTELINKLKEKDYSNKEIKDIMEKLEEKNEIEESGIINDLINRYKDLLDKRDDMSEDEFELKLGRLKEDITFFRNVIGYE